MRRTLWAWFGVLSIAGVLALPAPASAATPDSNGPYAAWDLFEAQTASKSCVACHVQGMLSPRVVYGGSVDEYENGSRGSHSEALTPCLACHVTHDESGMGGAVARKRLRVLAYQPEFVRDFAAGDPNLITEGTAAAPGWAPRDIQVTAFCTGCHPLYTGEAERQADVVAEGAEDATAGAGLNHPLRTASAGGDGTPLTAAISSTGCRSCHAAGETDSTSASGPSFPHSTPANPLFLLSAANAQAPAEAPGSPLEDGVCLRCHRWTDARGRTGGVGLDW